MPTPPSPAVQFFTVGEEWAGQRLDNFLLRELRGAPKTLVYRIIRSGEVRVNKGRAKAESKLAAGDVLRIPPLRLSEKAAPPSTIKNEAACAFSTSISHGFLYQIYPGQARATTESIAANRSLKVPAKSAEPPPAPPTGGAHPPHRPAQTPAARPYENGVCAAPQTLGLPWRRAPWAF